MWRDFDRAVEMMFQFVNGKKVVLWGYEKSGWFIEHLFKRANKQIDYIIDNSPVISPKLKIYRSFIIKDMNKDTHTILLTFADDGKARKFLEDVGFIEGKNFIFVRNVFYSNEMHRKLSYHDWLEYKYNVDIIKIKGLNDDIQKPRTDCLYYSAGIDYALMDALDKFVFNSEQDAVFDFGCGKGGALLLFQKSGIMRLGGVEYDSEIFETLCDNFKKVGCNTKGLLNNDAVLIKKELDEYNYFFMYNPFQGKTFDIVIRNIQESYDRRPRKITFIYSGTYCHNSVIQNSTFKLSKEIYTDYSVRYINVYIMND